MFNKSLMLLCVLGCLNANAHTPFGQDTYLGQALQSVRDSLPVQKIVCQQEASHPAELGIENVQIYAMKHQGDRYQVAFRKK
jgi:phage gp46-like protein